MDKRMVSFARGRVVAISLAGVLVTLGILCLAVLVSAQSLPAGPGATAAPVLVSTALPPVSAEELATPDLISPDPPSVTLGKTASPGTVYPGDNVKYTAVFTNQTGADVIISRITDTLPTNFLFLGMGAGSEIHDNPSGTSGTIVWTHSYTVPGSGTLWLVYNVKVNAPQNATPYTNQLQAKLSTGTVVADSAPVTVVGANLSGSKSASSSQVMKGGSVIYTVTLNNGGTATANLSAITDTLPLSFVFRQMVSGPLPAPTVQGRNLIWAGPISILPGGQLRFSYRVTVGGTINQVYANSVRAKFNDGIIGPYFANVQVLQPRVYLPLIAKPAAAVVYRLAYDGNPGDNYEVFAIDADGTDFLNVSNLAGGDSDPDWSPNGAKIAWVHYLDGAGEIFVANADGSNQVNLTNNAKNDKAPEWSPNGAKIAFTSYRDGDRMEVFVMDANGANVTKLTSQACESHDPTWSPNGAKIAFICGKNPYAEVYVMNADGTGQTRLTVDDTSEYREDYGLDWSPDNTRLVFAKYYNSAHNKGNIYIVDVNTKVVTQLTDKDSASHAPQWSPDGAKIAFSTYIDSNYELATMNPDGSNVVNLTHADKFDNVPRWSTDGTKIAFLTNRDGDTFELYVMSANGTSQFRLTNNSASEENPDWHP